MAVEDPDWDPPRSRQAIPKTRKPVLLPYVFFPRELPPRTNGEAMRRQIMLEIFLGRAAVVATDYFAPHITSIAALPIASSRLCRPWARARIALVWMVAEASCAGASGSVLSGSSPFSLARRKQ